jgi:hypothetical protein
MKNKFRIGDFVKIVNIENLDLFNPDTDEQDIYHYDEFEILDIIDYDDDDCDLLVKSFIFGTTSIINSERFVISNINN